MVCPGGLAEQWQEELYRRFHLPFEILTRDKLEAARTENWFLETALVVVLPGPAVAQRGPAGQAGGAVLRGNLAIGDEAHKLSATFFGGEVNSRSGAGWASCCQAHTSPARAGARACGFGVRHCHWVAAVGLYAWSATASPLRAAMPAMRSSECGRTHHAPARTWRCARRQRKRPMIERQKRPDRTLYAPYASDATYLLVHDVSSRSARIASVGLGVSLATGTATRRRRQRLPDVVGYAVGCLLKARP